MDPAEFLQGFWNYACPSSALRRGELKRIVLLGHPIVMARRLDGSLLALRDHCPHRGIPLSYGRLTEQGEVECCYHGWRFGGDGRCTGIPSLVPGQDVDLARIRADHFEIEERHGLVWVLIGPPRSGIPDLPGMSGARPKLIESQIFSCHVDHAVIGLMDPAHGPFVHRAWWWRKSGSIHEKAKRFVPNELGFTMASHPPSRNSAFYRILGGAKTTEIAFRLPGIRIETIRAGESIVNILTSVTPVDADHTRVTSVIFWKLSGALKLLELFRPLIAVFAAEFLGQDRRIVERQKEGLRDNPKLMLINDADTQARWYFQLKHLWIKSFMEDAAFVNPLKETVLRWRS